MKNIIQKNIKLISFLSIIILFSCDDNKDDKDDKEVQINGTFKLRAESYDCNEGTGKEEIVYLTINNSILTIYEDMEDECDMQTPWSSTCYERQALTGTRDFNELKGTRDNSGSGDMQEFILSLKIDGLILSTTIVSDGDVETEKWDVIADDIMDEKSFLKDHNGRICVD
jgi:hypothetical protein